MKITPDTRVKPLKIKTDPSSSAVSRAGAAEGHARHILCRDFIISGQGLIPCGANPFICGGHKGLSVRGKGIRHNQNRVVPQPGSVDWTETAVKLSASVVRGVPVSTSITSMLLAIAALPFPVKPPAT